MIRPTSSGDLKVTNEMRCFKIELFFRRTNLPIAKKSEMCKVNVMRGS